MERGLGVGATLGIGEGLGVELGEVVGVAVGVGVDAALPPQTIISLPVQTAVCPYRAVGAFMMLVAIQLSVPGLYLRPPFKYSPPVLILVPPQTIISLPVQIAVWYIRG